MKIFTFTAKRLIDEKFLYLARAARQTDEEQHQYWINRANEVEKQITELKANGTYYASGRKA